MMGLAVGSPLSPVIANLFMKSFEHVALEMAPLKPSVFKHYIDDIFILYCGFDWLYEFLPFLNIMQPNMFPYGA